MSFYQILLKCTVACSESVFQDRNAEEINLFSDELPEILCISTTHISFQASFTPQEDQMVFCPTAVRE